MRVLTHNCCALPILTGDIGRRLALAAGEISRLDPDLILLQEIFLTGQLARVRRWRFSALVRLSLKGFLWAELEDPAMTVVHARTTAFPSSPRPAGGSTTSYSAGSRAGRPRSTRSGSAPWPATAGRSRSATISA